MPHGFSSVSQLCLPTVKVSQGETCHQKLQVLSHTFWWKKKKRFLLPIPPHPSLCSYRELLKQNKQALNLSRVTLKLVKTVFFPSNLVVLAKLHAGSHATHPEIVGFGGYREWARESCILVLQSNSTLWTCRWVIWIPLTERENWGQI